jgi:hypothetical protein
MDTPLGTHIAHLEQKLHVLHNEIMDEARTRVERNRVESEIRAAELALVYYRQALELEQQLNSNSK